MNTARFSYGPAAAVLLGLALLGLGGGYLLPPGTPVAIYPEGPAQPPDASSGLPLPSRVPLAEYEKKLFAFLNARRYIALGWDRDVGVRDTGPYVNGKYYGTHPAVRVFYSPGVMRWLKGGR